MGFRLPFLLMIFTFFMATEVTLANKFKARSAAKAARAGQPGPNIRGGADDAAKVRAAVLDGTRVRRANGRALFTIQQFCEVWNQKDDMMPPNQKIGRCSSGYNSATEKGDFGYITESRCMGNGRAYIQTDLNEEAEFAKPAFKLPRDAVGSDPTMSLGFRKLMQVMGNRYISGQTKSLAQLRTDIDRVASYCAREHINMNEMISTEDKKGWCEKLVEAENKASGEQAVLEPGSCTKNIAQGINISFKKGNLSCASEDSFSSASLPLQKLNLQPIYRIVDPVLNVAAHEEWQKKKQSDFSRNLGESGFKRRSHQHEALKNIRELLINHRDNFSSDEATDLLEGIAEACPWRESPLPRNREGGSSSTVSSVE